MPAFILSVPPQPAVSSRGGEKLFCAWTGSATCAQPCSNFTGRRLRVACPPRRVRTTPKAILGGGGFLGVGAGEVVVILGVGWLLLGPEKLYALARDSGRVLGELRRSALEARETFTDALDIEMLESELKKKNEETSTPDEDTIAKDNVTTDDEAITSVEDEVLGPDPLAVETQPPDAPVEKMADLLRRDAPVSQPAAGDIEANATFLDQLRRVSNPAQVAPSEAGDVPDLGMEGVSEEELEVERLERQYIEARRRLEERQKEQAAAAEGSNRETSPEKEGETN